MSLDVKPILIDSQKSNTSVNLDLQTSSIYNGENFLKEVDRIVLGLENCGFKVIRRKVEIPPFNLSDDFIVEKNCYFEAHFNLKINIKDIKNLNNYKNNIHISKNIFKKHENDMINIMATKRSYCGSYLDFKITCDKIKCMFINDDILLDKIIIEYCILDDNLKHDVEWINVIV